MADFIPKEVSNILYSAKAPMARVAVRMLEIAYGVLEEAEAVRTDGLNQPGELRIKNFMREVDSLARELRALDPEKEISYTKWDRVRTLVRTSFSELNAFQEGRARLDYFFELFISDVGDNVSKLGENAGFGIFAGVVILGIVLIVLYIPKKG